MVSKFIVTYQKPSAEKGIRFVYATSFGEAEEKLTTDNPDYTVVQIVKTIQNLVEVD